MMIDSNDPNEAQRLAALHRYGVLDTPAEEAFDRITRLAQSALQVPIVLVSLIDENRQWFKSKQGLDTPETARDISFCTHALEDPRFRTNPLVTGAPNIRFYVGVPLRTPDGHNIGTLCAIDRKPRELTDDHIHILRDLASLVMDELELRRLAATAA